MTTSVRIHVNGRYRAIVKQDDAPPVIVEGNYEGSSNPTGEKIFWLAHPAHSTFVVDEEWIDAPKPSIDDTIISVSGTDHPTNAERKADVKAIEDGIADMQNTMKDI